MKIDGRDRGTSWALLRWFVIPDKNDPTRTYLRRLRVIQTPWFGLFIHWIYLPDGDRDPHDHPWPWFWSWVLRGGYREMVYSDPSHCGFPDIASRRRRRWSRAKLTDQQAHKITHVDPRTVTLVITGHRSRTWGFWTPAGFVRWQDYPGAV